jgi:glycerol kinase
MSNAYLAIDQGTSGTKAIVVDDERGVLSSVEISIRPTYGDDSAVEQDPIELLASVIDSGRQAVAEAGVSISAVGLANQGETVLAWDKISGEPLSQLVVWQDGRSLQICDDRISANDAIAKSSGLYLDPYFAAPKLTWLRDNVTKSGVVTTSDVWLINKLTGEFVTDSSTASRTLLLDLASGDWNQEALKTFNLQDEEMPKVVPSAGQIGSTSVFGGEIPLTGAIVDQQAALFAQDCRTLGAAKCTYGTGAFLLANAGNRDIRSPGLPTSVAWKIGDETTFVLDGQLYTVASAIRMLVDLGIISSPDQIDQVGSGAQSAEGVQFVPALAGLGAPWRAPDAKGLIAGMTLGMTRAHLVHALLDGIAAQVVEVACAMEAAIGVGIPSLLVDGGLTHSQLLMQKQADLLQSPVEVFASPHATALGAAAFARMGYDPSTPSQVFTSGQAKIYEPRISSDQAADAMGRHRAAISMAVNSQ